MHNASSARAAELDAAQREASDSAERADLHAGRVRELESRYGSSDDED